PERSRFSALKYPRFRRLWLGSMASVSAYGMIQLAQGVLIFDLTGSALNLGIVGAATAVPTILVTLFGGVLADRVDRRNLLAATQLVLASMLGLLATLVATDVIEVWHVYAIAVVSGLATGLDWPTRTAIYASLIEDRRDMMSAVAMDSILWQGARVVIPTSGGLLISAFGTATVFYIAAAAFVLMFIALMTLRMPELPDRSIRNPFREFLDGVHYIRNSRLFAVFIPLTFANMFFGMMYIQLMPAYVDIFDGGASQIGFMFTAIGIGSVTGTLIVGKFQSASRLGWIILSSSFAFSVLVLLFALSPGYFLAMGLAVIVGILNSVFMISTMTAMQIKVPEVLRGRVMGLYSITFSLIPLGGFLGGAIAELSGDVTSLISPVRIAIAAGAIILGAIVLFVAATQREIRSLNGRDLAES
ncbi:MAG: MFS transporter, partial [Chloroflexi bacterium]|nr:MFS transporter [Chloroflexota bacterium]